MEFASVEFWVAAFQIIVINLLLSGDNAIVIALMITDPVVAEWVKAQGSWLRWAAPIAGILFVIGLAYWLKRRHSDTANNAGVP